MLKAVIALVLLCGSAFAKADPFVQRSFGVAVPTVESVSMVSVPTAGVYKLAYGGVPTPSISAGSTAATVQAALRTIAAIPNTIVSGNETTGFTVTLPDISGPASPLTVASSTLSGLSGAIPINIGISTPGVSSYTVNTTSWTELTPSVDFGFYRFTVTESSGQAMYLGTGTAGNEVAIAIIPPNNTTAMSVQVPLGSRLALKAVSGNATTGQIIFNFWRL